MSVKVDEIIDAATGEITKMITDDTDFVGRMSEGLDINEFDAMAPKRIYDTPRGTEGQAGDELDLLSGDELTSSPRPFQEPLDMFPVFKGALRHFQATAPIPSTVRIDTPETYTEFSAEAAIRELERRTNELRAAFEAHESFHHGGKHGPLSKWEILGAADAVQKIQTAQTAEQALSALPNVPVDVAPGLQGAIRAWRDGDHVVVSIPFQSVGGGRIATMTTKPRVDADEVAKIAIDHGVDPVSVLGALPDLAASSAANQLVKETASAALEAQRRMDVCNMEDGEPVFLIGSSEVSSAPLAALMYVEQMASSGDAGAKREMEIFKAAASTPTGRQIAGPLLAESRRRLSGRVRR